MAKFPDVKTLHKFASVHASIHNHFNLERHLTPHETFKQNHAAAITKWLQLAEWYSHNFDIRRLVRIRLTAPSWRPKTKKGWADPVFKFYDKSLLNELPKFLNSYTVIGR